MARCTLNNMIMRNVRKTHAYQTMLVDLVLLGVVKKDTAEKLLGYEIPSYIELPADVADTELPADVADTDYNDDDDDEE